MKAGTAQATATAIKHEETKKMTVTTHFGNWNWAAGKAGWEYATSHDRHAAIFSVDGVGRIGWCVFVPQVQNGMAGSTIHGQ
jgi:hypothetical protein